MELGERDAKKCNHEWTRLDYLHLNLDQAHGNIVCLLFVPSIRPVFQLHHKCDAQDSDTGRHHRPVCRWGAWGIVRRGERLAATHMLTPPFCCVFTRISAQADQSGSSLRYHDQQLRVWEGFFPKIQPGEGVQRSAHQQYLMVYHQFSPPNHTKLRTLQDYADGAMKANKATKS